VDEIIAEFIIESMENLDRLDDRLLALERTKDRETVDEAFRAMHSIKGMAGCLGFDRLESLTHAAENLLGEVREGEREVTRQLVDAVFLTGDTARKILRGIGPDEVEPDVEVDSVIASLDGVPLKASDARTPFALGGASDPDAEDRTQEEPGETSTVAAALDSAPDVAPQTTGSSPRSERDEPVRASTDQLVDTTCRVSIDLLEQLVNQVGELVLARNQIVQHTARNVDPDLQAMVSRLNGITSELQDNILKARMQPVSTSWSRFPRIVRDTANAQKKRVRLVMEGTNTELDRTLIEALADPLVHTIRNAIDHGVESPEARAAAGKPDEATITLRAAQSEGMIVIDVIDDGGGIRPDVVRDSAVKKGLLTRREADELSDRDAVGLIFRPGFSTAEKVTNLSGRGVGMDVVRNRVQANGGTIDINSKVGEGTRVSMRIPLTLAIIPALIVSVGACHYAIPQANLVEIVQFDPRSDQVEVVDGSMILRLRDTLLPLVSLREILELDESRDQFVVAVHVDGETFGIICDDVIDTEEIVVKPLGPVLEHLVYYSGATIRGDGTIALILDSGGIGRAAGVIESDLERVVVDPEAIESAPELPYLLCEVANTSLVAALTDITRLEEISREDVVRTRSGPVVRYNDSVLPLVFASEHWGDDDVESGRSTGNLSVMVHGEGAGQVGVVVERVVDVVDLRADVFRDVETELGTSRLTVIGGRVAELLDFGALPGFRSRADSMEAAR
jgi:two-component system chemotaxis sensor kinase CheA